MNHKIAVQALTALALFTIEEKPIAAENTAPDCEEGSLSQDLLQDDKSYSSFSTFGDLIKPTPFQVFPRFGSSPNISIEGLALSSESSKSQQPNPAKPMNCSSAFESKQSNISQGSPSSSNHIRGILKQGGRSRFARTSCA